MRVSSWVGYFFCLLSLPTLAGEGDSVQPAAPGVWEANYKAQLERRVTFEFVDTPLLETTNFLGNLLRLNVIVDRPSLQNYEEGGPAINLKVKNEPLGETLKQLLQQAGLEYEIRDEAFYIFKSGMYSKEKERAGLALSEAEKQALEKALGELSSDTYQTREQASKTIFGLGPACVPALEKLSKSTSDSETFVRAQKILGAFDSRASYSETPQVARALNALNQKITFEFDSAPAKEVVQFVFAMGKGDFHFDDLGETPVTLKVTEMTLGNALRWLARMTNAKIVLQNNTPSLRLSEREGMDATTGVKRKKRLRPEPEE